MTLLENYGEYHNTGIYIGLGIIIGIILIGLIFAIIKKVIQFRQYKKENDPVAMQQTTQTPTGTAVQQVVIVNNGPQKKENKKPKIGFMIPFLSVLLFIFITAIIVLALSNIGTYDTIYKAIS